MWCSTNGERITEFDDEEDHKIEKYYSILLHEVARPEQGARRGPDYKTSTTKGLCEPGYYSLNVARIEREVITIPATIPILTFGESQTFPHDWALGVPRKRLTKGS